MQTQIHKTSFIQFLVIFAMLFPALANAADKNKIVVDIYRSKQITLDEIQKRYQKEIDTLNNILATPESLTTKTNQDKFAVQYEKILLDLTRSKKFAFVGLSPVIYQNRSTNLTIDIVDKGDEKRFPHVLPKPTQSFSDPYHLIAAWHAYEAIGFNMLFTEKKIPPVKQCPAYHCIFGFDHPRLKKYGKIFVRDVPKAKDQLVKILKYDKDENKRAASAMLLAHIKDGHELIKLITPSMHDSSSLVRNNVMRVLGEALSKVKNVDFPIQDAIDAVDYPILTDRNKALYILRSLSAQPRYARYIIQHAHVQLMNELKQSQQNVHGLAHQTLEAISGKKYGEHDYQSWQSWLDKQNKSRAVA